MPPRPPLADTVRLQIFSQTTDEVPVRVAANVLYCNFSPAYSPSASDLVTLANGALAHWGGRFSSVMNNSAEYFQCTATLIDGTETQGISTGPAVHGALNNVPMVASASPCVSWHISAAYRGGHPRSYLPFTDTAIMDNGTLSTNKISPTFAASIAAEAALFLTDMNGVLIGGSVTNIGTVSYYRGKALRPTPVFYPYGSAVRCNTRIASQRRRTGKLSVGIYEV